MPLVLDGTTGFSGGGGVATSTALGSSALFTNSTGTNLVAIGYQAGYFTTAGPNVFVGSQAGYTNSTGTNNVSVGYQSLYSNTTGQQNTAVGDGALQLNTASYNTAVGRDALEANTTGANNTALGYGSLASNTASNNTAVGYESAFSNTSGTGITAIGYQALKASTGNNNTALGSSALVANTTGTDNTAIGYQSLNANTTGSNNNGLGVSSLLLNTTGIENVAFGVNSLRNNLVDLVIMGRPPNKIEYDAFQFITNPLGIISGEKYKLKNKTTYCLEDLRNEKFIAREEGSGTRLLMEKIFLEKGIQPEIFMSIASNETIKQSVMANMGLTFISLRAVNRELDNGMLKLLNVEGLPYIGHWYVINRAEKKLSPSTVAFKNFIIEKAEVLINQHNKRD